MKFRPKEVIANFSAVLLLLALISTPLFFAKRFVQVAGVQTEAKFLIVSQIQKFPNFILSQEENTFSISFTKQASSQAFLGLLIINNPTQKTQTYTLDLLSGQAKLFFGLDPQNLLTQISVPAQTSVPISLYSPQEASSSSQTIKFGIN